jgi:hypothetical protein
MAGETGIGAHLRLVLCACAVLSGCASMDNLPFAEPETQRLPGSLPVLGPIADVEWKESTVQWGVRPLFSVRQYRDVPPDGPAQFDVPYFAPPATLTGRGRRRPPRSFGPDSRSALQVFALYPLFRHESCEPMSRTVFMPLYYDLQNRRKDVGWWHHWGFFPLYFGGNTDARGRYHAVFPLGGVLKNWLGRDKIRFVLFPLYVHTTSGERDSYHILFPFIGWSTGGERPNWRIWPLVGRMQRHDKPPRWFFLWPFFWYTEDDDEDERPTTGGGVFPLWTWHKVGDVVRHNVLWPLFSYARNSETGRTDYVVPWPLLRIGSGPGYSRFQLWPLFGTFKDEHIRRSYWLWPLVRLERRRTEHRRMNGTSLFIFYRSIERERVADDGENWSDYENLLWPLWYYKRDRDGNSYFATLNLRGVPDPQGWDRLYSFLWRVYEHEERPPLESSDSGRWRSTRALWGMFRYDRDAASHRLSVFPLFESRRRGEESRSLSVLAGMFGYADEPGRRTYRTFFIPWSVSREESE